MKKTNYSYLVWGFLFLTIGIIWAGNIGNYWYVDIPYLLFYKGFWTFFIILPCIVNIFQKGFQGLLPIRVRVWQMFRLKFSLPYLLRIFYLNSILFGLDFQIFFKRVNRIPLALLPLLFQYLLLPLSYLKNI